jgi:hypothetical protein
VTGASNHVRRLLSARNGFWTALLLVVPGTAWLLWLSVAYALVSRGCQRAARTSLWILLVVGLAGLAGTAALAWWNRPEAAGWEERGLPRARFVVAAGAGVCAVLAMVALAWVLAALLVSPCDF